MSRISAITLTVALAIMTVACAVPSLADKPAPTINSISPASVTVGSASFAVTVMGSNFTPSAVVLWNGSARATTFISKSQLLATILSEDVAQTSTAQISVASSNANWNSAISNTLTMTITSAAPLQIVTSSLPTAVVETPYAANVAKKGGIPPYTWKVADGQLPPGLALNQTNGAVSGVPVQKGNYSFVTQITDSSPTPQSASQTVNMSVTAPSPLLISTSALPNGTAQVAYNAAIAVSGGTAPYVWSVASGALPPGLALSASTGAISGTPSQAGGYTFTVQVKDSEVSPQTATNTYSITVAAPAPVPLQITTSSLPGGQVQAAYQATLTASGGTVPYTWKMTSGTMPPGLTLAASTGQISGTPSTAGAFGFIVQVADSAAQTSSASFTISVATQPSLSIVTASLPAGTVGASYNGTLLATGGTQPYTWSIVSGQLPGGLSLSASSGIVSGTPTASGSFSSSVQVADAGSQVASQGLTVNIAAASSGQPLSTYTSRTDLNAAPEAIPAQCSPAPCTMTSSDLNPNLTYLRVTSPQTTPFDTARQWGTNGSAEQMEWNSNSSLFYAIVSGGAGIFFKFDPVAVNAVPINCTFTGGSCWHNLLSTVASSDNGDGAMSGVSPYVFYGQIGAKILKQDFTATVSNPAGADTVTTIADFANCPNIPTTSVGGGLLTMNDKDTRMAIVLGPGQDQWFVVPVWDTTSGCRWLNLANFTVGGDWGPSGSVTFLDEAGNVLPAAPCSQIHNVRMDRDGRWARISTQCNQQAGFSNGDNFFWDIATANLYRDHYTGGGVSPYYGGGHIKMGFDNILLGGDTNYSSLFYAKHTLPPLVNPAWMATGYYPGQDNHTSWNNQAKGQLQPAIVSFYGTSAPASAWQGEIVGISTDGSGKVYRFAHQYTRAHDFNAQGIANVSRDGKWAIFCSDWGGTSRDDVYLVPLK